MKLVTRPAARQDILNQYKYYLFDQGSESASERFLVSMEDTIQQILRWPGTGAPVSPAFPGLNGLRSASIRGFPAIRIYYLVSDGALRIIRVLHGKRDLESILQDESLGPS